MQVGLENLVDGAVELPVERKKRRPTLPTGGVYFIRSAIAAGGNPRNGYGKSQVARR